MIFFSAELKSFQLKTLTSFSIFLGFGGGNPIMSLKNSSDSGLPLETVKGRNPSRFLLILFFSSTVNRAATSCSSRDIASTLVTKHSFFSSQYMQLMQMLLGGLSSGVTGWKVVVIVLPDCDRLNCTSRLFEPHSSSDQSRAMESRSPVISSFAL